MTTAAQAVVTMASLSVAIVAPQAAHDIGIAPEHIGLYASLTFVGAMVGPSLPAGSCCATARYALASRKMVYKGHGIAGRNRQLHYTHTTTAVLSMSVLSTRGDYCV